MLLHRQAPIKCWWTTLPVFQGLWRESFLLWLLQMLLLLVCWHCKCSLVLACLKVFWYFSVSWVVTEDKTSFFLTHFSCLCHRGFQNCHKVSYDSVFSRREHWFHRSFTSLLFFYLCRTAPMFPWTTTWCSMMLMGCTRTPLRLRERLVIWTWF